MENAMETPSILEVPRPSSSMITKDLLVILDIMYAVSFISVMKVLILCSISSLVPKRDNSLSRMGMVACNAGTKHPIWAITIINATCFMYTVLPEPLGPLIICMLSSELMKRSLGTKEEVSCCCGSEDTTACRPALITKGPSSHSMGRVNGCGFRATKSAKDASISNRATLSVRVKSDSIFSRMLDNNVCINSWVNVRALVIASDALLDSELNSSVLHAIERLLRTACVNPGGRGSSVEGTKR
mmetsp:Transcript_7140/g.9889  ORF Transcript_7140/g.9889 Transcript_7140/m.9889 type:complete len:243 (+) Transcript_7140:505-1233(+)